MASLGCLKWAALLVLVGFVAASQQVGVKMDGWTEVRPSWPVRDEKYFIATEKGHHFIEVKVPANLEDDLMVKFRYYYSYAKVKPVIQMTPCNANIYLVNGTSSDSHPQQWNSHVQRVSKSNCKRRPELAYNVLLHDPGDVFAWSVIEIHNEPELIASVETTTTTTTSVHQEETTTLPVPEEPTTTTANTEPPPTTTEVKTLAELMRDDKFNEDPGDKPTQQEGPKRSEGPEKPEQLDIPESSKSGGARGPERSEGFDKPESSRGSEFSGADEPRRPAKRPESPKRAEQPEIPESSESSNGAEETEKRVSEPAERPDSPMRPASPERQHGEDEKMDSNEELDINRNPDTKPLTVFEKKDTGLLGPEPKNRQVARSARRPNTRRLRLEEEEEADDDLAMRPLNRYKRDNNREVSLICRPDLCDRNTFKMARFTPIIRQLPAVPQFTEFGKKGANKYLFNNKMRPLVFNLENEHKSGPAEGQGETFEEVDTCIKFLLYMEANTELEFSLASGGNDDNNDNKEARLLETIKRTATDSSAGKWDSFSRCISDYMPAYRRAKQTSGHEFNPNQLRFIFKQNIDSYKPDKRVAMLIDPKRMTELRRLYSRREFIPDLKQFESPDKLKDYWVLDKDGVMKAEMSFIRQSKGGGSATSTSNVQPDDIERVLLINNIDSSQDAFDITSRWMMIKDAELIDDPILFVYRAEKADWIQRIDLEFQRAGEPFDKWTSQTAYTAPLAAASSNQDNNNKIISLPIRMTGLNSEEFRLRVRHLMKKVYYSPGPLNQMADQQKRLVVKSMAFGDGCASENLCQNGATCTPTGATKYECTCRRGFSGEHCDKVRPCEVVYGDDNRTGYEFCASLGASCVEGIPVMRCQWPNDKYYHCQALFSNHSTGSSGANQGLDKTNSDDYKNLAALPPTEQVEHLKGIVNQQAKLIIILAVFIAALMLFAVVLIGNMVVRVRKTSKRLARSKSENHELARRVAAVGSASGATGQNEPTGGLNGSSLFSAGHRTQAGRTGRAAVTSYNNAAFDVE